MPNHVFCSLMSLIPWLQGKVKYFSQFGEREREGEEERRQRDREGWRETERDGERQRGMEKDGAERETD